MDEERLYRALGMFAALAGVSLDTRPIEERAKSYTRLISEYAKRGDSFLAELSQPPASDEQHRQRA